MGVVVFVNDEFVGFKVVVLSCKCFGYEFVNGDEIGVDGVGC